MQLKRKKKQLTRQFTFTRDFTLERLYVNLRFISRNLPVYLVWRCSSYNPCQGMIMRHYRPCFMVSSSGRVASWETGETHRLYAPSLWRATWWGFITYLFSLIKCFILDGFFFGEGKVPIVVSSSSYHSCDRTTEGMVAMGNKFGVTSKKCTVIVKARMPHGFPDKPLCCKFQKFNGCGFLSAIKFSIFARSKLHEPFKPHQPAYESTESNGLICGYFFGGGRPFKSYRMCGHWVSVRGKDNKPPWTHLDGSRG